MTTTSKRKKTWQADQDRNKKLSLLEAIEKSKKYGLKSFSESLDLSLRLGIDPKKGEQNVRGSCTLPHGTGKSMRVLVFAKGEKEKEAKDAGADYVGGADLSEKIKGGFLDFDRVVATPDMMGEVGKIAKILGPKGLMPNPKLGTVTMDLAQVIGEIKKGKVEFRVDKAANLHVSCGKLSFEPSVLSENIRAIVETIIRLKPAQAKGVYLRSMFLSSTMGPSFRVDESEFIR